MVYNNNNNMQNNGIIKKENEIAIGIARVALLWYCHSGKPSRVTGNSRTNSG